MRVYSLCLNATDLALWLDSLGINTYCLWRQCYIILISLADARK